MAADAEVIPFTLRTGTGAQNIPHVRKTGQRAVAAIFLLQDNTGTNSECFSVGYDDGITHIANAIGETETFGVCLGARGSSAIYSLITEQAQAFFGGASRRMNAYVTAFNVGSVDIQVDFNGTPGAQWVMVIVTGCRAEVGIVDVSAGLPQTKVLANGSTPVALLTLNCPDPGGDSQVAGGLAEWGFATLCGPEQCMWGIATGSISSDAKRVLLDGLLSATISAPTPGGTVPTVTKFLSAWTATGFTIDGVVGSAGDFNIGFLALSDIAANLVTAIEPHATGAQAIALTAGAPLVALFGSAGQAARPSVNTDAKTMYAAYDGVQQSVAWWAVLNAQPSPYKRDRRGEAAVILDGTPTGPSLSTVDARAIGGGFSAGSLILNWNTVNPAMDDHVTKILVLAVDQGSGPCGAGVTPPPVFGTCFPSDTLVGDIVGTGCPVTFPVD